MIVARSPFQLRRALDSMMRDHAQPRIDDIVRQRPRTALIPTMGALHEGHLALLEAARADGLPITVVSIFVNPTQFAPGEDYDSYPRAEEADLALLEQRGADVAFLPSADDIYPEGFGTTVLADRRLTSCLCGSSRGTGHFDGVATVVARLFGLTRPDTAWFGEKDWQQLQVIRRMAADIHPGVEIMPVPTVRAEDGLALSSRNERLSGTEREAALAIPRAIESAASDAAATGSMADSERAARSVLLEAGLEVDYVEIRSSRTLQRPDRLYPTDTAGDDQPRIFIAARCGDVRLIDNSTLFHRTAQPGAGTVRETVSTP